SGAAGDHHRRHAAASRTAGRGRGCRQGRPLRAHVARPQVAVRDGVTARGKFISLEGGEGAGKSTQVRALAEALKQRGIDVLVTRATGGSEGAEKIRELLLAGSEERWGATAEALLFAAARADHVEK